MWLCKYFVYFTVFSCLGWVYETIFCTIKNRAWDNRGFLHGPVCPIYGVGGTAITILMEQLGQAGSTSYTWQQVFLISFFGSIVLEYVTSWGLEKLFHAYWWDYSNMPLNIKGRVCLPCSIGFGFAGVLIVYGIAPVVSRATEGIPPIGYEFLALLFMCILSIDVALTVSALTDFEKRIAIFEELLNQHMEQFVETAVEKRRAERERFSKESMERALRALGGNSRRALSRIKGFRPSKKTGSTYRDAALAMLRKLVKK